MNIQVPEFYQGYINKLSDGSVVENLIQTGDHLSELAQSISDEQAESAYAEGKWTIKEVLQHLNDAERVFCYRALRFARNDSTELSGFDQDAYVPQSRANERKLGAILNEFHILRASSIDLFANLNMQEMRRSGKASGGEFTVESIGYIISGHTKHHADIIKERYLNGD